MLASRRRISALGLTRLRRSTGFRGNFKIAVAATFNEGAEATRIVQGQGARVGHGKKQWPTVHPVKYLDHWPQGAVAL